MATSRNRKTEPARAHKRGATRSSDLIDQQLARYRAMRDFQQTPEPSGAERKRSEGREKKAAAPTAFPFVIQKHAATRLHYDFRLGLNGVLKSWAVTKGPSYVTADKRLAVQVEDHPMEYGGFEGSIPKGQYGGGTVMLWDEGTWEPLGDPEEGLAKGNLKFTLHGKKLKGNWVLVRMGGRFAKESKPNWLLIKEHDEHERTSNDPAITEEAPNSVLTGRDLEAIARENDHVWNSNGAGSSKSRGESDQEKATAAAKTERMPKTKPFRPGRIPGPRLKFPEFIPPQLASQRAQAPVSEGWVHELKLDGYRIQAHINGAGERSRRSTSAKPTVHLFTRSGLDWTRRMPSIAAELGRLNVESAVLDGEVVVLEENGNSSFARLQNALDAGKSDPLTYFAFDLLYLNGHRLMEQPLLERKRFLSGLIGALPADSSVRASDYLAGDGQRVFTEACRLGAEGIVSKRAAAPYVSGRGASWVKVKCNLEQEFVIAGFTLPSNGAHGVGALLLGYYEKGRLQYAGRTGTGFTQSSSRMLRDRLDKLRQPKPAFAETPADGQHGAIWTKPELIAQVKFQSWTADRKVRQSSFQGLREDITPETVRREVADSAESSSDDGKQGMRSEQGTQIKKTKASKPHTRQKAQGEQPPALRVTHPDKIIDAESKLTKQAFVDYSFAIAPHMLRYIAGRPLTLLRCPEGTASQCFYQKHLAPGMPVGIEGVMIPNKNGKGAEEYVTVATPEGIAGLAQMNVIEIHPWGSTNKDLEHPNRLIFDLDPDDAIDWSTLADAAREIRGQLGKLGLKSFVKLTGGKGLHVVAPLTPHRDWEQVKAFARAFTLQMEQNNSKLYIAKMSKAARKNKIFIDYLRNERDATAIAPYSARARRGMPVALPLSWPELKARERPRFTVAAFNDWKSRLRRDPWKELAAIKQEIPAELFDGARK